MLLSTILTLSPTAEVVCSSPTGRHAQAWFLDQIKKHSPALSQVLHAPGKLRPYTISGLMTTPWKSVRPGDRLKPESPPFYLRVTTLSPELSGLWLSDVLPNLDETMELSEIELTIKKWTHDSQEHALANQSDYADLIEKHENTRSRRADFNFLTPTAFRSGGADVPLPIPGQLMRSWWDQWNSFAPPALHVHPLWPRFAEDCVHIHHLDRIRTSRWHFGRRRAALGFAGNVGLLLLRSSKRRAWSTLWPGAVQVFQALSEYAFYCGTGHHTTIGMGQTDAT
jgi:CRISPR-associated endoribonuclease Cas6